MFAMRLRPHCPFPLATLLLTAVLAMPWSGRAYAAEAEAIRASTLFNLLLFVDWPAQRHEEAHFRLCLLAPQMLDEMTAYADRSVRGRPLHLQTLGPDDDGLSDCHAAYAGQAEPATMRKLLATARTQALLIITEDPRGIARGAMINLLPGEGHYHLELNPASMQQSHLRPHAQLLAIARRTARP